MMADEYRILEKDEAIMAGDEWMDDPVWHRTIRVGERAPDPQYPAHRIYRRRITPVKSNHSSE
jgi:hypothetical protein